MLTVNDYISQNIRVPSPGSVNDKIITFFSRMYLGEGSPEGVQAAEIGSYYFDIDAGTAYGKQTGSGNTGWILFSSGGAGNILTDPAWTADNQFIQGTGVGTAEVVSAAEAKGTLLERTNAPSVDITGNTSIDITTKDFFDFTQTVDAPVLTITCSEVPPSGQMYSAVIRVRQHQSVLKTTFTVAGVSRWAYPNLAPVLPQVTSEYVEFIVESADGVVIEGASPTQILDRDLLTTKGDIYAATAASSPARVGAGTNGYVLTADSTQTAGVGYERKGVGTQSADVTTSQTTTSTTYTDLATAGPEVTATIGVSGMALVLLSARMSSSASSTVNALMGVKVDATEATDVNAVSSSTGSGAIFQRSALISGLSAGAHVFTCRYKVDGAATGTFSNRRIVVIPL